MTAAWSSDRAHADCATEGGIFPIPRSLGRSWLAAAANRLALSRGLSRDPAFRWQPEADAIRHADYSRRALDRIAALGPVHVPVADLYISSDLPEEASKR